MNKYEANVQYKKSEPWYTFVFEANSLPEAKGLAKAYEIERVGYVRFHNLMKRIEVNLMESGE